MRSFTGNNTGRAGCASRKARKRVDFLEQGRRDGSARAWSRRGGRPFRGAPSAPESRHVVPRQPTHNLTNVVPGNAASSSNRRIRFAVLGASADLVNVLDIEW